MCRAAGRRLGIWPLLQAGFAQQPAGLAKLPDKLEW